MQGTLFDTADTDLASTGYSGEQLAGVGRDALGNLAFLYTASEKGNSSGIRFAATIEDAQKWCSSPVSRGQLHGVRWAYFWTSAANYINCHWDIKDARLDLKGFTDSGEWDERIAATGCKKIALWELPSVLSKAGIEVLNAPAKPGRFPLG